VRSEAERTGFGLIAVRYVPRRASLRTPHSTRDRRHLLTRNIAALSLVKYDDGNCSHSWRFMPLPAFGGGMSTSFGPENPFQGPIVVLLLTRRT
jgi:hypothetical protein